MLLQLDLRVRIADARLAIGDVTHVSGSTCCTILAPLFAFSS